MEVKGQTEYRDPNPIPAKQDYTADNVDILAQQIAKFIREKMYGADVRESLARWVEVNLSLLEYFRDDQQAFKVDITGKQNDVTQRQSDVEDGFAKIVDQFADVIANVTVDSELINARDSESYGKFPILDTRLENIEELINQVVPVPASAFHINHNLGINPNSVVVKYYENAIGTEKYGLGTSSGSQDNDNGVIQGYGTIPIQYKHTAWSWSADGSDRFMTSYPAVNYVLNSAVGPDKLANAAWEDSYALLSDEIRGLTGEFEIGFDVTLSEDVTNPQRIDITLQTKGEGLPTFDIFPFRYISLTPGITTHVTNTFTGDYTAFTGSGGRIASKFGGAPTVTMHLDNMYIKRSQESNTWTPAPEDSLEAIPQYRGEYIDSNKEDSQTYTDYVWKTAWGFGGTASKTVPAQISYDDLNNITVELPAEYNLKGTPVQKPDGNWYLIDGFRTLKFIIK